MSFDLSDDELERQLTTMLRERAASVPERTMVDRGVVARATRRRRMKAASVGSGLALVTAIIIVAALTVGGSPVSRTKNPPAHPGPSVELTAPPDTVIPTPKGWTKLPPAPMSARSASATAIVDDAFVVWGGEGAHHERLLDGAWYDLRTGEWHRMSASPLPKPSYPYGRHFVIAQAVGEAAVIVSDGAVAQYSPRTDAWKRLPDVPLRSLDNLALPDTGDVMALTGIDRAGRPAYAALTFDSTGRAPVWTTGTLTGRSDGRPALTPAGLTVLVHGPGGTADVDTVLGLAGPATATKTTVIPRGFVPTTWTGQVFVGGGCPGCFGRNTLVTFDPSVSAVSSFVDSYDSCAGLHVWTGRYVISWGSSACAATGVGVAFDPLSGTETRVPQAPIALRRYSDFAAAPDGRLFVWGGQDASGGKLADGAILNMG